MIFSITGFAYLLLSLGLGIIALRCFNARRNQGENRSAKILTYFFIIFAVILFLLGTVSLFGKNQNIVKFGLMTTYILDTIGCSIYAYLVIYLSFPKINPLYGFVPVFILGTGAITLNYFQGKPFVTDTGGIVFGLSPLGYLLTMSLFIITFIPMIIIFAKQFKGPHSDAFLKTKSIMFVLLGIVGIIVISNELIFEPFLNLEQTLLNEISLIGLNLILYTLLLNRKLFEKKW